MNHVKEFEYYLKRNIVKKQIPDLARAKALVEESNESYKILISFIKNNKINEKNSNYIIKNTYDIIMELVRAKMLSEGFNASGQGAHEAEVSFLRNLKFTEKDIDFADKMRYFRNGIVYYGKRFDEEYAKKVLNFLEKIYLRLK